jgi:hypothetical protein
VFDLYINGRDSPLINLKIDKVLKFDNVMRSMGEIHFRSFEKEEDQRFVFIFGHLGSWRRTMVEIIMHERSMAQIHLGFGQICVSVEVLHLRSSMADASGMNEFGKVLKFI